MSGQTLMKTWCLNGKFGSDGSRMRRVEWETRGLVSRAQGTHCLVSPVNALALACIKKGR
jgi:hypothetical protein